MPVRHVCGAPLMLSDGFSSTPPPPLFVFPLVPRVAPFRFYPAPGGLCPPLGLSRGPVRSVMGSGGRCVGPPTLYSITRLVFIIIVTPRRGGRARLPKAKSSLWVHPSIVFSPRWREGYSRSIQIFSEFWIGGFLPLIGSVAFVFSPTRSVLALPPQENI